jgi:predicted dehydrogenase
MPDLLRIAVVGAGFMGQLHARTVAEGDVAELAAIVDLDPAAKAVADGLGTKYLGSIEEALADDSIDAYVVALPDRAHVGPSETILRAGKALLLEKPMADTLEGAKRIARAAREGNARLLVAHILRHDPRYVEAARTVASGAIGDVLSVSSGRFSLQEVGERLNGGSSVLFYLGVHDVDAAQWISGLSIKRVYARATGKLMKSKGIDSEDAILAAVEFEDGTAGQLHAGWTMPANAATGLNARTFITGSKGSIEIDARDSGLRILSAGGFTLPDGVHWPEANGRIMGDLTEQHRHFVRAVQTGEEFLLTLEEGLRAVAVNDAILRSVESGRPEDVEAWTLD